jgi:outer membrane protein OmpA-like peptidoglycan-associated protein
MPFRSALVVLLAVLGGCARSTDAQRYSVYFQPYSAQVDPHSTETIHQAALFAQAHPSQPVAIDGFSAPPDPKLDVKGLSAQRAEIVKQALINEGVGPQRITTEANGITDPQALPTVAVRRVDISIGR